MHISGDKTSTGIGDAALHSNKAGVRNTAAGGESLAAVTAGDDNTAVGYQSLASVGGSGNIAIGSNAGARLKSGNANIYIGHPGMDSEDQVIRIGTDGEQSKTHIAGIYGVTTDAKTSAAVVIDQDGQLGTISSSRRYKVDIAPMADASNRLLQLRPVTFRYRQARQDGERPIQFGLIAEEVAEVFPDLVVYNKQGEPETVAYHLLASLLLNELQKEHQLNAEQGAQLVQQQAALAALERRLGKIEGANEGP